jgi:hypothetical protein
MKIASDDVHLGHLRSKSVRGEPFSVLVLEADFGVVIGASEMVRFDLSASGLIVTIQPAVRPDGRGLERCLVCRVRNLLGRAVMMPT